MCEGKDQDSIVEILIEHFEVSGRQVGKTGFYPLENNNKKDVWIVEKRMID